VSSVSRVTSKFRSIPRKLFIAIARMKIIHFRYTAKHRIVDA
jgi:hypothetical protein